MALTIYTVSDPAVVGSVMTSMAMFFGQDSWVGGALKLALIISLLVILAKGVLAREGLRLDAMLLQLLVIMVAFIPKTTVIIEQFEHNAPTHVVDDVPYAIAMPGAIAGTFALYMTQKIETVMSSVDGKYIAPSGELDPYAPARMLMQIATAPLDPTRFVDPNLLQTIHHAARFCGKPSMTNIKFEQAKNSFAAFADEMTMDGTKTFIFDAANPYRDGGGSGRWATCEEAATYIRDVGAQLESSNALMFENTMKGIAQTADTKRYSDTQTGSTNDKTADDILPIINRVAPMHAQLNTLALANVMSYTAFAQLARDSKGNIDDSIELQRDTGLFNWAKEESAKSLLVSATAPKFMDILFFIFIASTPIVMFVVAANPATGFKVAGAYVLFGLWTQSWIPMMAIISGWYQAEIKNFATMGTNGLTPEYLSGLMRHVSTATITASNMMQSAPYLMFAIMTGSMFAMSSMIAKVAPSGGATSGGMGSGSGAGGGTSPLGGDLNAGGKLSPGVQAQTMRHAQQLASGGSGIGGVNPLGDVNTVAPGMTSLGVGSDVGGSASATQQQTASARSSLDKQSGDALKRLHSLGQASSSYVKGEDVARHMTTGGYAASYDSSTGTVTGSGWSWSAKHGFTEASKATLSGNANAGGGFGAKMMKVAGSIAAALEKASTETAQIAKDTNQDGKTQSGTSDKVTTQTGGDAAQGKSGARGAEHKRTAQEAKELSKSFQSMASQSQALDKADQLSNSATSGMQGRTGTEIKGSEVAQQWQGKNNTPMNDSAGALAKVQGAIGGELASKLGADIAAIQNSLIKQGALGALSQDGIAAVAAWKALDKMGASGNPADKLAAMEGQANLARAAGMQDITPQIAQLRQAQALVDTVNGNIGQTKNAVEPVVAAAVAGVNANLSEKAQADHRGQTERKLRNDQGQAGSTYAAANEGMEQVKTTGDDLRAKHENANFVPDQNKNKDPQPLMNTTAATIGNMNLLPKGAGFVGANGGSVAAYNAAERRGEDRKEARENAPAAAAAASHFDPVVDRKVNAAAAANAKAEAAGQPPKYDLDQVRAQWQGKADQNAAARSDALNYAGQDPNSPPPGKTASAELAAKREQDRAANTRPPEPPTQQSGAQVEPSGRSTVENATSAVGGIVQTLNGAVERGTTASGEIAETVTGATGSGTSAATVVTEAVPSGGSAGATPGAATTGDHKGIDLSKPGGGGGTPAEPASAAPSSAKPTAQRGGGGEGPNGGRKQKAPGRT